MAETNTARGVTVYDEDYREVTLKGTEDWRHVAELGTGGGYEWETAHFYYSPVAHRFFWRADAGCSCRSWRDGVTSVSVFEDGDRQAAMKAVRRIVGDWYSTTAANALDTIEAIRNFNTKEN